VAVGGDERDIEGAVIDEHDVSGRRIGAQMAELFVWVEDSGSPEMASQFCGTDQNGAADGGGQADGTGHATVYPSGGQRLARNAVVVGIDSGVLVV